MIWSAAAALALSAAAGTPAPAPAPVQRPTAYAQVTVRQQIILRVPIRAKAGASPLTAPRIGWEEGKGPKCLVARSLVAARVTGRSSVDLLLRDQSRVRAKLEKSCAALDFYIGIYIRPDPDGRVCADRDSIRSRVGGACEIEKFRSLKPVRKD